MSQRNDEKQQTMKIDNCMLWAAAGGGRPEQALLAIRPPPPCHAQVLVLPRRIACAASRMRPPGACACSSGVVSTAQDRFKRTRGASLNLSSPHCHYMLCCPSLGISLDYFDYHSLGGRGSLRRPPCSAASYVTPYRQYSHGGPHPHSSGPTAWKQGEFQAPKALCTDSA